MEHSIQHSISKVGLPLIVTSSKPSLCFLIDTGATHNVIFSFVIENLKNIFRVSENQSSIMGIEGEIRKTPSITAIISFGEVETSAIYSVLDNDKAVASIQNETGIQIHGILGIPFLMQNKWILDFNNLKIITA